MSNAFRKDGFTTIEGSDHLDGYKYSQMDHKLTLKFQNGYQYVVHGFAPEDHQSFLDAPSQGEHFHNFIKPNYHIERVK